MKIKTLLLVSIVVLFVFLIYLTTLDKKVYYLALGDSLAMGETPYGTIDYGYTDYVKDYLNKNKVLEKYINEFSSGDYRTTDLIRDIEDNRKIIIEDKPQTIKNAMIKADLMTLSIGINDLLYKIGINNTNSSNIYDYIDEMMLDMDKLFKLIREYCKEDILIIGYYTPSLYLNNDNINGYIDYANKKLEDLSEKYEMVFINIDNLLEGNSKYIPNPKNIHPSKLGYKEISKKIISKINKKLLK